MKRNLAVGSLLMFGVSVILLIALTLSEAALTSLSPSTERIISFLLLVAPAAIGVGLGMLSLSRQEDPKWAAITGLVLNTLFALFHLMVILFAG